MKVTKKEYKEKQNQAAGMIVQAIIAVILAIIKSFDLYQDYLEGIEPGWVDFLFLFAWLVLTVAALIIWRKRERELRELEVD